MFHRDRTASVPARFQPTDQSAPVPAGTQVIHAPPGELKMSEVLEDFVAPWVKHDTSMLEHKNLLSLAIVAWNVALLPEADRELRTDKFLTALIPSNQRENLPLARRFVAELVERKLNDFAPIRRFIYSCKLTELGNGQRHISVASTFDQG